MDNPNNENWREILSRMEGKIDQLESDIQKLSRNISPSWWKKFAGFIIDNFFTILTFISLVLIAWKALEFYENIAEQLGKIKDFPKLLDSVKDFPKTAGDSLLNSVKELPKEAGDSLIDSAKDLIKNIKF